MKNFILICGLPYSGKTTIAKQIEKSLGYKRITVDDFVPKLGFDLNIPISERQWKTIYESAENELENCFRNSTNVIFDATNLHKNYRDKLKKLAKKYSFLTKVIFVNTPIDLIYKRHKDTNNRHKVQTKDLEEDIRKFTKPEKDEKLIEINDRNHINSIIILLKSE